MKTRIENHFSLLMIASLFAALLFPALAGVSDFVPPAILAFMMLFSCATLNFEELKHIRLRRVSLFYGFRFLAFPLILYGFCLFALPEFRYAILLVALLPVAVSAASLALILEGSSTIGLAATVVSSLIAPFLIPAVFGFIGLDVSIDIFGMFKTLCAIVFAPALLYFLVIRHFKAADTFARSNAAFVNVICFSVFIFIVVSKLREQIMADLGFIAVSAAILAGFFFVFYALGWLLFRHEARASRISYTLFSGCMNSI